MSMSTTITVEGMTCGHCVAAVQSEVGKLDGVTDVAVDLASGRVTVTAERTPDPEALREAVEEAGYEIRS
ncbi:MAG: heavy-metal-associated domain-containing protein [Acidimicrobiales bacterium]